MFSYPTHTVGIRNESNAQRWRIQISQKAYSVFPGYSHIIAVSLTVNNR